MGAASMLCTLVGDSGALGCRWCRALWAGPRMGRPSLASASRLDTWEQGVNTW